MKFRYFVFVLFGFIVGCGEQEKVQKTSDEDPFTLSCDVRFSLKKDENIRVSQNTFFITFEPRNGEFYLSQWKTEALDSYSFRNNVVMFHKDFKKMNNRIKKIGEITDDVIWIGDFRIDRNTAKFENTTNSVNGECKKHPDLVAIPRGKLK